MSSKNGANSEVPAGGGWSISKRLAFLFSLANLLMLVLATGYLYFALVGDVSRDDSAFLAHKIQECGRLLEEQPGSGEGLEREVRTEPTVSQFIKYYLRVLDENDRIVAETPGMNSEVPASAFADSSQLPNGPLRAKAWKNSAGHPFLLMSERITSATNQGQRLIQAAVDASADESLLWTYRRKLLVVLLFGIFASWMIGLLVARRGLQPLKEITQATDRVSVNMLHERIATKQWPDELFSLATSFDRMMERLEGSFNHLLQFSADLAHEIRTPINNLRGQTGVALSQSRTAEEYRRTLESNLEEYARLSRLVENLLFLARADRGSTVIAEKPCSARASIEKVREFYEAFAEDRGVEVLCEGDADLYVDPALFEQAISNLLSNALNYSPQGGKVRISVFARQQFTEVSVSDRGCGIAAEHLPKIFDRFYRVDPARTHEPSGYGLGLAIVKSIVHLHSGNVEVESRPGKGTTFKLAFPRRDQEEGREAAMANSES